MTIAIYVVVGIFAWAAGIYGLMELLKRVASIVGFREAVWFRKALRVLPLLIGGVTGLFAVPAVCLQLGLDEFVVSLNAGLLKLVAAGALYFMIGLTPGALSGQAFEVIESTFKGAEFNVKQG
jgi:hypothetical protein